MSFGRFQIRRDTAANWTSNDPTLASGEIGFETDTGQLKIGDGSTTWTSLSYFASGSSYTDEDAQDALGGILTDSSTIDFTYNDGAPSVTADIIDGSVTYAKIQDVSATDKLLGRSTAGAGVVEEIPLTAAGRALIDDADAAAQRTTLGLGTLATQSGTFSGTSSGTNTGDQNLFQTIQVSGQSDVVADTTTDTLTLAAGTGVTITTNAGTDTITINSSITQYTDEMAQDSVGGILTDTSTIDFTYNDGANTITADVINDSITYAKIQNVSATDRVLGRVTAGAGDIEEITMTAAGRALIDDADATAQRTTLGLGTLATQSGTFSGTSSGTNTGDQNLFQTIQVSGQSDVVADTATDTLTLVAGSNVTITTNAGTDTITIAASGGGVSDGDKGDITISGSGTTYTIDNDVVTFAKMQNIATDRLLGRDTASSGDPEELTVSGGLEFTGSTGIQRSALTGDVTASAGSNSTTIANDAVTYAKMQDVSATNKILGRSTAGAGNVEEIDCTAAGRALLDDADATAQRTTLGLGTLATQSGTFSGTSSGTNTGDQNLFGTISVSGQSDVVADTTSDTLTLVAGSNVTITTNAGSDSITIAASGGGSGLTQPQVMAIASLRI